MKRDQGTGRHEVDRKFGLGKSLGVLLLAGLLCAVGGTPATASAKLCFGKKVNRVIHVGKRRVELKAKDVIWLGPGVKVRTKPFTRVCAGGGRQVVRAGKGQAWVSTGPGDDIIRLHESSNHSQVEAGSGDDRVFGAKGHDSLDGGPGADEIWGGGGNDRITDTSGIGNLLFGEEGSDQISSLGSAVSELHGGNGSDFMYSNGGIDPSGKLEQLFGEKGNDRLNADQPDNLGPAYLDGGEGDDWMNGTPQDDVAIFNSGIKKIRMGEGDDLMVASGRGYTTVDGGPGIDTISYEALTSPYYDTSLRRMGIRVRLVAGVSQGYSRYGLAGIENVIGSAFNDQISGVPGQRNVIRGGLGDDVLAGDDASTLGEEPYDPLPSDYELDGDVLDGGLGTNQCFNSELTSQCPDEHPGSVDDQQALVSIEEGGVLTVLGSRWDDTVSIGYDSAAGKYLVSIVGDAVPAGLCSAPSPPATVIECPADINRLTGILVFGGAGDDRIGLDQTIPSTLTTTLAGGYGRNLIQGGPSKDFITSEAFQDFDRFGLIPGSAGSELYGGDNLDVIYANDAVTIDGEGGPDSLRVTDPCLGAQLFGGDDPDSVVFAGARGGVKANLAGGYAEWWGQECPAGKNRTTIGGDVEKLEGSGFPDWLIIGKRGPDQQGKSTLLGREGNNRLDAKNGDKNTITTGPEEHSNTVRADPEDKVIWGWGLAAF